MQITDEMRTAVLREVNRALIDSGDVDPIIAAVAPLIAQEAAKEMERLGGIADMNGEAAEAQAKEIERLRKTINGLRAALKADCGPAAIHALEIRVENQRETVEAQAKEIAELRAALAGERRIEFRQHDWLPGFAAFLDTPEPQGPAFCVLNLGSMLCAVECGEIEKAELPYFIAESMMHEIMHVIEKWAGAEFSEDRIEALLEKYRVHVAAQREADAVG